MVFGQVGKGILILLCSIVFGFVIGFINGILGVMLGAATAGIAFFVILFITLAIAFCYYAILIVDSYKVGKTLAAGKPIGKWRFFPSP